MSAGAGGGEGEQEEEKMCFSKRCGVDMCPPLSCSQAARPDAGAPPVAPEPYAGPMVLRTFHAGGDVKFAWSAAETMRHSVIRSL